MVLVFASPAAITGVIVVSKTLFVGSDTSLLLPPCKEVLLLSYSFFSIDRVRVIATRQTLETFGRKDNTEVVSDAEHNIASSAAQLNCIVDFDSFTSEFFFSDILSQFKLINSR